MSSGTMTARRAVLRWRVMPVVLISLAAGLGSVVPAPQAAADAASMAGAPASPAGSANPVTVYVVSVGPGTVTPIATAANTAGPLITTGNTPEGIAITPDGKTAYVANYISGAVTPIATATNTAGPPITVGSFPIAIAITPATATQGPAFTSGSADTAAFGRAFTFTVTATGDPAPKITRTGRLPSGVRFADYGDGTATISGTPRNAAAGVYPLTLTARNKNGTATQAFTLTVTRAPAIRRIPTIRTRVGVALRLTVRATGYPAPALAESGPLPGGLSFTDNGDGTATIAGTPAAGSSGHYPITITATNTSATSTRHFTITVFQPHRR
jgi:YVTN family beta-propeller protein